MGDRPTGIGATTVAALQQAFKRVQLPGKACGEVKGSSQADLVDLPTIPLRLDVAGLTKDVVVDGHTFLAAYAPTMRVLLDAWSDARRRTMVALAGVPGSGKSTFVATLAALWQAIDPGPRLCVIGMDGWHLTNAELDARRTDAPDGSPIPLRRRKGSPSSFDVERLASDLATLKQAGRDVGIPVYDRRLHDPVPDGLIVPANADIVLVEGNYLLLREGPWTRVAELFDVTFWLDIDPAACHEGIIARHVAGGMERPDAEAKYAENDRPNSEVALAGREHAQWIIELDARRRPVCFHRVRS